MKIKTAFIQFVRRASRRLSPFTSGRAGSPLPAARANVYVGAQGLTRPTFLALALATALAGRVSAQPVVTNVTAAQQPLPSKQVYINYTISDPNHTNCNISILVSQDSGATWTVPAFTLAGDAGANVSVTTNPTAKAMLWNAGADWDGHFTTRCRVRVLANDQGMAVIPPGSFLMGDSLDGHSEAPVHAVTITKPYYMDSTLVTGGKWNLVKEGYADSHGYTFDYGAAFKAANHPVQAVDWFDAVKWCNARSEMEGLTPVYYTNTTFSSASVYRFGITNLTAANVNLNANGYRLPTEAEWEKAARGGATGHRFPWTDVDTSSESRANYLSFIPYIFTPWDMGPSGTNATALAIGGGEPWTTPVGSFPPNGYGLFDMAGNVEEWCWDWDDSSYYTSGPAALTDPQGGSFSNSGGGRVARGGNWGDSPEACTCSYRGYSLSPYNTESDTGFRCVRGVQ